MNTQAHGAHAVQTVGGTAAPQAPARRAVVAPEAIEPARPVDGWGFANRILVVATVLIVAFELWRAATGLLSDGPRVLGEDGVGWVAVLEAFMFALVGGAIAGAAGYGIVLLMGGAARSAARYAIGGLIGGFLAAVGVIFVFSNTAALSVGGHLFWMLPLAGLIGGAWAGITSAKS